MMQQGIGNRASGGLQKWPNDTPILRVLVPKAYKTLKINKNWAVLNMAQCLRFKRFESKRRKTR
jgi:hypothetical protein